MAVGDQIHQVGDSSTTFQPSSGVEIIIKTMAMGWRSYVNYFWAYTYASGHYSYAVPGGAAESHYTKSQSGLTSYVNLHRGGFAHPINNSKYLYIQEVGSSHYHIAGYITKD